jgi:putative transcriptional regulator
MPFIPEQGQILLASSKMLDPNFVRTVVLLVRHNEEGSLGLVLNRPLDVTVKEACEKVLEKTVTFDGVLYHGGPCEGPLMTIHNRQKASEQQVVPGVHYCSTRDRVEMLLDDPKAKAKYFVNYSGWGPGQLEGELEIGSWVIARADAQRVFDESDEQWTKLMRELTLGQYIKPDQIPDDPSMN